LRDALAQAQKNSLLLFVWEGMAGSPASSVLKEALKGDGSPIKEASLFVGPEGGFTQEEVELAETQGAVLFGLGTSTLRGETAAIAAAALVLYEAGVL